MAAGAFFGAVRLIVGSLATSGMQSGGNPPDRVLRTRRGILIIRRRTMPAYLVRTIDEHDIVGIFVADEMNDLLVAVDECTDPDDCEYIELPVGGIMWTSPAIAV